MKKFSKLLVLLFALVAIMTIFSVVTFAATESDAKIYTYKNAVGITQFDYENYVPGTEIGTSAAPPTSLMYVAKQKTGNKYLFIDGSKGTSSASPKWEFHLTYTRDPHTISSHPILAFDFDVMTPTGNYGTDTSGNAANIAVRGQYWTGSKYASTNTNAMMRVAFSQMGLSTTPYEWQHVTLVFQHLGNDQFYVATYINGSSTPSYDDEVDLTSALSSYNYHEKIEFGHFYIAASNWSRKSSLGMDNFEFTYFPAGTELSTVPTHVYDGDYQLPDSSTEAVAVVRAADKTETVYSSAKEAIAAAVDGDTVVIFEDVDGLTVVDKAITVRTAMYINAGTLMRSYKFSAVTSDGIVENYDETTGIHTFTRTDEHYTVNWDPACEGECTCPEGQKHLLTASTSIALGAAPKYVKEEIAFDSEKGLVLEFLGWSYNKNDTVENAVDLSTITATEKGTVINLYPIYKITQYSWEVISPSGSRKYYSEENSALAFSEAESGSTVNLWTDVKINKSISITKSVTIDFNGFDLIAYSIKEYYYAATYDEATGTYSYPAVSDSTKEGYNLIETKGSGIGEVFAMSSSDKNSTKNVTIKSSKPGTDIFSVSISHSFWKYNDELLEKNTVSKGEGAIFTQGVAYNMNLNIYGEGISMYTSAIIYSENHNNDSRNNLYINGGSYYNIVSNYKSMIHWCIGGTVTVENALFAGNADGYFRTYTKAPAIKATFTNCDFINNSTLRIDYANDSVTFIGCRMYARWDGNSTGILGQGTLMYSDLSKKGSLASEDLSVVPVSKTYTYNVITESSISLDPETLIPTGIVTPHIVTVTYNYMVVAPEDSISITWKDAEGNVLANTNDYKGALANTPSVKIPYGDGYRAYTNPLWLDLNGNVADLTIKSDGTEFVFVASEPENPKFVAQMTNALFNMTYYGHLAYNLYTPVDANVTINAIGDYAPSIVLIGGKEYYTSNAGWITPQTAIDDTEAKIVYTIDGVSYTANFKLSALIYANIICDDYSGATEVETDAIKKLIAYIEEIYEFKGLLTAEASAKFNSFFNDFNEGSRPAYITEYPENESHTVDTEFSKHVNSFGFNIHSDNRFSLVIVLNKNAVDAGYKITVSGISSSIKYTTVSQNDSTPKYNDDGSLTYFTDNTSLANGIMSSKYTVSVVDAQGNVVATTNYSLATYIKGVEGKDGADVAKAIYTLGKALIEVRNSLY